MELQHSVGSSLSSLRSHHSLDRWSNLLLLGGGERRQAPEFCSNRRWAKAVNKPSIKSTERQALVPYCRLSDVLDIGKVER